MEIDCIRCKGTKYVPLDSSKELPTIEYQVDQSGKLVMQICPLCKGDGTLQVHAQ